MSERLGVGIICFERPERAAAGLRSIRQFREADHDILLFDNTESDEVGEWARHHAADVAYVRSPYNVGCWIGRCRIAEHFLNGGIDHFVIQDDDVTWAGGDAAAAMRAVFARHDKTGVVSWHLATRQMSGEAPEYQPDETGAILETPGMCCAYSRECIEAVLAVARSDGCDRCQPWTTRALMYRGDTLLCLLARKAGYATRVVWPDTNLVRHNHPHGGVARHPRMRAEQQRSRAIFKDEIKRHGLSVPQRLRA